MSDQDTEALSVILERIKAQAEAENLRVTQHAQQEMTEDSFSLDDVLEAIATSVILENYPMHRRGACCLLYGRTHNSRSVHIVCTTEQPVLIIITVYEPKPPKWPTPMKRRSDV